MRPRALLYREDGALRAPWRLLAFAAIAVVATWILQVLVLWSGVLSDAPAADPRRLTASFAVLAAALMIAHAVMLRLVDRRPWAYAGLGRAHVEPRPLVVHGVIAMLAIAVPVFLLVALGWLRIVPEDGGTAEWLMFALSALALLMPAALFEELLFRGYPFAVLRESVGWPTTVVVTSVLFALVHTHNPGAGMLPVVVVFAAGVWLAMVLLVTGSLIAATVAHLAWNWTLLGLLHAPVSGLRLVPPGYRMADTGPAWATGGIWGPEGGVFALLGLGGVTWYLFKLWQNRADLERRAE